MVDLGKQVGPLPLGAWLAVVGVGGGIALYSRNSTASTAPPVELTDLSGDAGVGTGAVGGFVDTSPTQSTIPGDTVTQITDNMDWGRRAVNLLINDGYDAAQAQSAITKALANGEAGGLSPQEWTLWRVSLMKLGAPPESALVSEPNSVGNVGGDQTAIDEANARAEAAQAAAQAAQTAQQSAIAAAAAQARQTAINFAGWLQSLSKGWSGTAANTAIGQLRAGGLGTQTTAAINQGNVIRRATYLKTHPELAKRVNNTKLRRELLNAHPGIKREWLAIGGTY